MSDIDAVPSPAFEEGASEEGINNFHFNHCWEAWQAALASVDARADHVADEREMISVEVPAMTTFDADMVWPDDDGETMFHTIDDAVDHMVNLNWPDTTPLEVEFQIAKRIPSATIRIFNISENGHEWEIVPTASASSAGDREVRS